MKTAKELRDRLEELGFDPKEIERAVKVTAAARHKARMDAALAIATSASTELLEGLYVPPEDRVRLVPPITAVLLAAELVGCGGPAGLGGVGRGTTRAPWAQELGSGRANARDGGAWDAAIEEALTSIIDNDEVKAALPGAACSLALLVSSGLTGDRHIRLRQAGIRPTDTQPYHILWTEILNLSTQGAAHLAGAWWAENVVEKSFAVREVVRAIGLEPLLALQRALVELLEETNGE